MFTLHLKDCELPHNSKYVFTLIIFFLYFSKSIISFAALLLQLVQEHINKL